jgi:hypothetical protein
MPNPDRKAIEYNLIWMERTFKERRTTERLLAPELENGILTQHDYDLAVNFLPGLHRHYNVRVDQSQDMTLALTALTEPWDSPRCRGGLRCKENATQVDYRENSVVRFPWRPDRTRHRKCSSSVCTL